jgi:hypothetical protein
MEKRNKKGRKERRSGKRWKWMGVILEKMI